MLSLTDLFYNNGRSPSQQQILALASPPAKKSRLWPAPRYPDNWGGGGGDGGEVGLIYDKTKVQKSCLTVSLKRIL